MLFGADDHDKTRENKVNDPFKGKRRRMFVVASYVPWMMIYSLFIVGAKRQPGLLSL